jgi:NarL family two-component system response regulator LiaR
MTEPIRIVLCDDHDMVREALARILDQQSDLSVVGSARDIQQALEVVVESTPEVAVVDIRLNGESGIHLAQKVKALDPNCKVVMLTSFTSEAALVAAYELGASAFLLKSGNADELIEAIRDAAAGVKHINPEEVREAARRLEEKGVAALRECDATDKQILRLLAEGRTDHQISEEVFLSLQTVRNRMSRLLSRFDKENRTQLALMVSHLADELH